MRRGLYRRPQLGEVARRRRRPCSPAPTPTPQALADWVARTPWIDFLAEAPGDPLQHQRLPQGRRSRSRGAAADGQAAFAKAIASVLEKEKVAYDIGAYRDAPPGLRVWCGATVETADVEALTYWLDYAFALEKAKLAKAA